jgi:hypothetical protein
LLRPFNFHLMNFILFEKICECGSQLHLA